MIKIKNTLLRIISISLLISTLVLFSACGLLSPKEEEPETTATPTVKVTFPEGFTVIQIAERLEENGVCSANEFMELCKTVPEGYNALLGDIDTENKIFALEGYIFPDTYEFYVGEGAKNALSRFLDTTRSRISIEYFDRAEELGLTMNEVFTLASIIQSECGVPSEMGNVSSVFHKRLENQANGFPYLGSDVTRHYIEKKMKSYIEENDLDYDSLFAAYCTNNKYPLKTQGLPSGPICNPGMAAIEAALWPSETDYLYFFTDKEGNFNYFRDYDSFNTAWKKISE